MNVIEITNLNQAEVADYMQLTEAQLRNRLEPEKGIFIAESLKVVRIALQQGYVPVSFLAERKYVEGQITELVREYEMENIPVYTGSREIMAGITGYELSRGFLCAMRRPILPTAEEICRGKHRVAVMDGVVNSTNTGAIFRAATALGIEALLLTPTCCDPLNRRSVRVSMGTVFQMPWTYINENDNENENRKQGCLRTNENENRKQSCLRTNENENRKQSCLRTNENENRNGSYISILKELGFTTVALALSDKAVNIDDPSLKGIGRMAIIMGTEGDGLPKETIAQCDHVAMIPMRRGVDSLNVAAAAAVAFWELVNGEW